MVYRLDTMIVLYVRPIYDLPEVAERLMLVSATFSDGFVRSEVNVSEVFWKVV
ncbi:uncharacterized protein BT62DRAFT_1003365 [Guyanagaster necrorhizus]|uniref:Uncharacterized protein n=1 Tax=Guyanagaster necrorhizus TaxID=856835 RepID=A0A9P7VXC5_9AGAR|nr:uncharacterized protein BT62DRAFT_1003365 [Guyanagaster necrorhizus MCA 3950]KAG7448652.1 hypothetical protein BT62DRAFT_1003365 [Guyanagaster necrorhizus MCA 3950]